MGSTLPACGALFESEETRLEYEETAFRRLCLNYHGGRVQLKVFLNSLLTYLRFPLHSDVLSGRVKATRIMNNRVKLDLHVIDRRFRS